MRIIKNAIRTIVVLMLLVTNALGQGSADFQEGRLYVRLKPNVNAKTGEIIPAELSYDKNALPLANKLSPRFRVKSMGRAFRDFASHKLNATTVLTFESTGLVDELIAELKKDPNVELVEKIPADKKHLVPNDPSYNSQWHLAKINAATAWDYFSTGATAVVAVVDDAVERTHPDLNPNIWVNSKEIIANGLDDDGNGYVDDINGWDLVDNDNNPDPPTADYNHGTHVAGIVSAASNNGIGIASMGYSCKLMCLKASGSNPQSISAGYAGIIYAANNGANVINCSWGSSIFSATNQDVINYALGKGAIVVASAGNNNNTAFNYPGAYTGVVSVASTDINDVRSGFSTYGEWVKISAPGSAILSTIPFGGYGVLSGTSMASPLVAGLVGLMKSLNPGMPNNDLLNCLYNTCNSILIQNPTIPGLMGAGRINAQLALACVAATVSRPPIADFSASASTIVQGSSITFTDKSIYNPTTWQWSFPGGTPNSFSGKTPPAIVYNTSGTYNVSLTVTNAFGNNTKTITNMVTVNDPPSCVSVNFPIPPSWTLLTYRAPVNGAGGFRNGVNVNGDKQKAMFFDVSATNLVGLTKFLVRFDSIDASNGNKKIWFRIYDGTSGTPGTELGVVERTKAQLRADWVARRNTEIDLPQNIDLPASKKFFISVDISQLVWDNLTKDSLSIRANSIGQTVGNPAWDQKSNGTWVNNDIVLWPPGGMSLLIHPFLTSKPAKSVLSPKNPVVCLGTNVEFDATGSVYNDLLKWDMPGAIAPTSVENQMKVTPQYTTAGVYKVYLTTKGGCSELRLDSAVLTINAAPVVNIAASKNPICLGETATLTASGATSYSWSPAAGLSATTGAQVQANPSVTSNYTVTGTTGSCSSQIPFELIVRGRTTNVIVSASETNITSPTSVTFTAAAVNGGSTPNYNFRVNSITVQNGSNSVLIRTVSPGDKVMCEFTSSEPCVDEKTVASNEIIMGEGTLPVTLVSLTGQKVPDGHQLNWFTASEANSDRFLVQKSFDGTTFENLGEVMAAGNSNSLRAYSFLDLKPNTGNNYYRLKMVDKDATFRFSNIVLLIGGRSNNGAALFPNPTVSGKSVIMQLNGIEKGSVSVSISSINGQVLKNYRATSTDGSLQMNIPATGLPAGSYLIICRDNNGKILETLRWQVNR